MKITLKYLVYCLGFFAILYFAWRCYIEYDSIVSGLTAMFSAWHVLLAELFLMILNVSLEVLRWRMLDESRSGSSGVWSSYRVVLFSNALSAATPLGFGEHLVKAYSSHNHKLSLMASLLGSFIQTSIIVVFGFVGLHISGMMDILYNKVYITLTLFALLTVLALFFFYSTIRRFLAEYSLFTIFKIYLVNILKVAVFMLQLYLLLSLSFSSFHTDLLANVMIYYMVITIIPSAGLADVGIRGSVALAVFGSLVGQQWSGVAAVMVWLINRLLPSLFALTINFFCPPNTDAD